MRWSVLWVRHHQQTWALQPSYCMHENEEWRYCWSWRNAQSILSCKSLLNICQGLMPDEGEVADGIHKDGGDTIAVDCELWRLHLPNKSRCWRLKMVHMDPLSRGSDCHSWKSWSHLPWSSRVSWCSSLQGSLGRGESHRSQFYWKLANLCHGPHENLGEMSNTLMPLGPQCLRQWSLISEFFLNPGWLIHPLMVWCDDPQAVVMDWEYLDTPSLDLSVCWCWLFLSLLIKLIILGWN